MTKPVSAAPTFHQRIQAALADPQLQSALDNNAERRQNAFTSSFESLPESRQSLRQRLHAVRAEVIAHLDQYLDQFTHNAQANGITVHFAADGRQAVEIVLQIAAKSGAKLIAKSKTMVGEEIHLNQHLERHKLQVVETDLGEYIIQLRNEPPAHIITPAVHLTRAQVAQTFEEKIGLPFTTDIPSLTAAARDVLRQTFLDADIGISGVNFGVAETGMITLVTNEGNGRMCTTLPAVHIALMGLERLVPGLDDLALALSMLPRSATGQKLSVYTSLIRNPRRPDENEGPLERHLILLDNGRRSLRDTSLAEALFCIRCGACLNACPVFREIGGHAYSGTDGKQTPYPGPIGSVISPGLFGVADFGHLARASSLCGACKDACPADIDLPKLLLRVRAQGADLNKLSPNQPTSTSLEQPVRHSHVPLGMRLGLAVFARLARSPSLFGIAQRLGGLACQLIPASHGWMRLPAFTGWGFQRDFPRLATRPFSASRLAHDLSSAASSSTAAVPLIKTAPAGHAVSAAPIVTETNHPNEKISARRDLVEAFIAELDSLGGEAIRCHSDELLQCLIRKLKDEGVTAIQSWEAPSLPPGLLDGLRACGIEIQHSANPDLKVGLTGALASIAESGSLVLAHSPGQPATASLLPEIHLAVLRCQDIYERLSHVLQLPAVRQASSSVIITGPSRTADIEMTLTIGVHGPRQLIVYVIDGLENQFYE